MPADTTRLGRIERVATSSLIADRLREAIVSGTLAQGAQLGEADLAARFGVSRGPLREAMQRLVQEGLLHSVRHRGLFVAELTADDIRDVYAARMVVERAAVEHVVTGSPPAERERAIARLERAAARMSAAAARGDAAALSRTDLAFHERLVAESGSPRLQRMASTLLVEARMCLAALPTTYPAPRDLADEHAGLVAAMRAGDLDLAVARLRAHMDDAVGRLTT